MNVIRTIFAALFGATVALFGFVSTVMGVMLLFVPSPANVNGVLAQIALRVFNVLISEALAAFGVVTILYGFRFILGPSTSIVNALNGVWSRARTYALIMAGAGFILGVIAWCIEKALGN